MEHCVVREVREETGVPVTKVSYHSSQPWPFPNSIMLGFNAEASQDTIQVDGHEIEKAQWFSRPELRSALQNGSIVLPTPISIAYRLIEDWFNAAGLGKLSDIVESLQQ
ncbi:MAG: NUDIX domain-containing protein [Desulfobacteraceae bacterium]|nr:MAG: NUDIX domain-containing protein [Desulfobacteraceae bacterium]